jgi:hypothetical protein
VIVVDVLGLVGSVINGVGGGRRPVTFRISAYDMYGPQNPTGKPAFGRFEVQDVMASVRDLSLPQRLLEEVASGTAWALITLVIAVLARRVVDAAIRSDPFTAEMADRLRRLAVVVLIGGAAAELTSIAAAAALYVSAHPHGAGFDPVSWPFGFWWMPLGFALLAFAAVVRHGCTLRAELDQVI